MHRTALTAAMFAAAMSFMTAASAAEDTEDAANPQCERKLVAKGFPNLIASVASMSALRLWAETALDQYGPDYAMWHNAASAAVRCNVVKDSEYTTCV